MRTPSLVFALRLSANVGSLIELHHLFPKLHCPTSMKLPFSESAFLDLFGLYN